MRLSPDPHFGEDNRAVETKLKVEDMLLTVGVLARRAGVGWMDDFKSSRGLTVQSEQYGGLRDDRLRCSFGTTHGECLTVKSGDVAMWNSEWKA